MLAAPRIPYSKNKNKKLNSVKLYQQNLNGNQPNGYDLKQKGTTINSRVMVFVIVSYLWLQLLIICQQPALILLKGERLIFFIRRQHLMPFNCSQSSHKIVFWFFWLLHYHDISNKNTPVYKKTSWALKKSVVNKYKLQKSSIKLISLNYRQQEAYAL